MKLNTTLGVSLSLLWSYGAQAAPPESNTCVVISEFHNTVSAESSHWHRAQLNALSRSTDSCDELKLGLLLSHPTVSFQNDSKALDAMSHALLLLPDEAVDKPMLSMVLDHIEERQTLRNMLGKLQHKLRYRQQQVTLLSNQIDQLNNLEAQLEDKAREAMSTDPETVLEGDPTSTADENTVDNPTAPTEALLSE